MSFLHVHCSCTTTFWGCASFAFAFLHKPSTSTMKHITTIYSTWTELLCTIVRFYNGTLGNSVIELKLTCVQFSNRDFMITTTQKIVTFWPLSLPQPERFFWPPHNITICQVHWIDGLLSLHHQTESKRSYLCVKNCFESWPKFGLLVYHQKTTLIAGIWAYNLILNVFHHYRTLHSPILSNPSLCTIFSSIMLHLFIFPKTKSSFTLHIPSLYSFNMSKIIYNPLIRYPIVPLFANYSHKWYILSHGKKTTTTPKKHSLLPKKWHSAPPHHMQPI